MSEPIFYVDSSQIREGKLEELKTAIRDLAEFVVLNEPQLIAYRFYINEDATLMMVIALHPDSASMELHMNVAGALFPKFAEFIRLLTIDLYGRPSDELIEQMRQKAAMLGHGAVRVHKLEAGFARLGARSA